MKLKAPKSQKAHLLHDMIKGKWISEVEYPSYNGFRDSLSELRLKDKVVVGWISLKFKNQFGREAICRQHFVPYLFREEAISVYKKINP